MGILNGKLALSWRFTLGQKNAQYEITNLCTNARTKKYACILLHTFFSLASPLFTRNLLSAFFSKQAWRDKISRRSATSLLVFCSYDAGESDDRENWKACRFGTVACLCPVGSLITNHFAHIIPKRHSATRESWWCLRWNFSPSHHHDIVVLMLDHPHN